MKNKNYIYALSNLNPTKWNGGYLMKNDGVCPVVATAEVIGRRWALIIINNLMDGPLGFNELKRRINGVSSKTLSMGLVYLADEGIVARTVHSNSPIRVEYSLTQKGLDLKHLIEEMRGWGERWLLQPKKRSRQGARTLKSAPHIPAYS